MTSKAVSNNILSSRHDLMGIFDRYECELRNGEWDAAVLFGFHANNMEMEIRSLFL
jgi:hypothetical protein